MVKVDWNVGVPDAGERLQVDDGGQLDMDNAIGCGELEPIIVAVAVAVVVSPCVTGLAEVKGSMKSNVIAVTVKDTEVWDRCPPPVPVIIIE